MPAPKRTALDAGTKEIKLVRFIYLLLIFSPLPFASARPVWEYMWAVFVGLSGLVYTIRWKSLNAVKLPKAFYVPVGAVLFLIFWGVLQVVMGWSVTPERTITTTLYFLSHLAWFFLIFKSFQKSADIPKFVLMNGLIVSAYCVYGLIVYFSGNDMVLWYEKWASHGALTSTFVNRNSFASFIGLGLQCMVAYTLWICQQHSRAATPFDTATVVSFFAKGLAKTSKFLLCLIILMTCLLLTASRGGITSSLVATSCLLFSFVFINNTANAEDSSKNKRPYFVALSIVLAGFVFSLSGDIYGERMGEINSDDLRFFIYPLMIDAIGEAPVIGTGLGTFSEVFAQYRISDIPLPIRRGHSDVLEIYMTGGAIVGSALILSFLFVTAYVLRNTLSKPQPTVFLLLVFSVSLQMGLHSIVDFSLQMPAISYLYTALWAAGGYLAAKLGKP